MELLRQETDEQHPMAATVVCQKLNDMEVACDRRTLTRDIQALNDYGYEVMSTMISHEKAYYIVSQKSKPCSLPKTLFSIISTTPHNSPLPIR